MAEGTITQYWYVGDQANRGDWSAILDVAVVAHEVGEVKMLVGSSAIRGKAASRSRLGNQRSHSELRS